MKWIEDYVDRETAVARKWVQCTETAIRQEQEDMRNAAKARSTIIQPEKTFQGMLNTVRDCLSDLVSPDDEEVGGVEEDEEEET